MKLSKEQVMVAKGVQARGTSVRQVAKQLGVTEGALRYRLKKLGERPNQDGRARRPTALGDYADAVEAIQKRLEGGRLTGEGQPCQVQAIHEILVRDHSYRSSYQAVVRHPRRKHGKPKLRALRRVETPPGVQTQHDWFEVRTPIGSREQRVQALVGTLSHSHDLAERPEVVQIAVHHGKRALDRPADWHCVTERGNVEKNVRQDDSYCRYSTRNAADNPCRHPAGTSLHGPTATTHLGRCYLV